VLADGGPVTVAATEPFVVELDNVQYETGEGPCLDAIRTRDVVHVDDLARAGRYRRFAPRALEASVASMVSAPVEHDGEVIGSLNLLAGPAGSFGPDEALEPVRLLAACAAAVVVAQQALERQRRTVSQLEDALQTRDLIGQAKGILMAHAGVDADDAFRMLVRASQRENRKLRDVAFDIADRTHHRAAPRRTAGGAGPGPGPG
jgi:transcriptional regulator with GAF, ATPase, and Fis domain